MRITSEQYKEMTGEWPNDDDLDRVNCDKVGEILHLYCGICEEHNKPRFVCGCMAERKK